MIKSGTSLFVNNALFYAHGNIFKSKAARRIFFVLAFQLSLAVRAFVFAFAASADEVTAVRISVSTIVGISGKHFIVPTFTATKSTIGFTRKAAAVQEELDKEEAERKKAEVKE